LSYRSQTVEPPQFDERELAQFVLMAHLSVLQHFPGFGPSGREAAAKLLCAYPYSQRIAVSRLLNACVCRVPDERPSSEASSLLKTVVESIRSQKRLRLVTRADEREPSYRTKFDPHQLQLAPHDWSLTGHSSLHRGRITLGMRSIRSAELTSEPFELPRGSRR
jgi:predicted DNA-binding transcriptional regulator YafY